MADDQTRRQLRDFRRVVASVVGELRSQEVRDTYASVTMAEVIDAHLKFLAGPALPLSRRERLVKTYDEFLKNVDAIKATEPSAFRLPDPKNDVNTPR